MVNRQPADWVNYYDDDTGRLKTEYVTKGKEKEYFEAWKRRGQFEHNPAALQLIDKFLDERTDWPTSRIFGNANDQQANHIDALRMKGLTNEQILKAIDPNAVVRPNDIRPDLVGTDAEPRLGGSPEELREAEDEWEAMQPVGTGTGVDPRPTPGEWKNGVLEIPSEEGGKGLRIDLNNQPWMKKKKNGIKI